MWERDLQQRTHCVQSILVIGRFIYLVLVKIDIRKTPLRHMLMCPVILFPSTQIELEAWSDHVMVWISEDVMSWSRSLSVKNRSILEYEQWGLEKPEKSHSVEC